MITITLYLAYMSLLFRLIDYNLLQMKQAEETDIMEEIDNNISA